MLDQSQAGELREDALAEARQSAREAVSVDLAPDEREMAGDLAAAHIAANLAYSAEQTDVARQAARAAVDPVRVSVQRNEAVVRAGDLISTIDYEKLTELGLTEPEGDLLPVLGYGLLSALLSVLLVGFLWRFQPAIWHRTRSLVLFLLILFASAIVLRMTGDRSIAAYLVPTSAAVMLTGLLLGGAAGGAMAIGLAVVAGLVNSANLGPVVYVTAGGLASLVVILQAERLNAFVRAGLVLALVNVTVVVAFGLLEGLDATGIAQLAAAGLVNAALSVILAIGGFAFLGNVFGILTIFQMLELANPSNRLLRRLLLETPGTYHHSVMVGNLAERASETIGADPLLARVAAYYHDIGKMKNPLAFIENQAGGPNIHDDLSPETSARIIAAHVRDGVDLAQEYKLPPQVAAFIPQHHGTAVMGFFHGKALAEHPDVGSGPLPLPGPAPAIPGSGHRHARRRRGGLRPIAPVEGRRGDSRDGGPHRGWAPGRRSAGRQQPHPARHRAHPRGVRGAAAGHVPPADQLPGERPSHRARHPQRVAAHRAAARHRATLSRAASVT